MNEAPKIPRRKVMQAGLAGLGLLAGGGVSSLLAGGCKPKAPRGEPGKPPLDSRFTYDISAFERTDPAQLLYREAEPFPTGFEAPHCLAVDAHDLLYVGGDQAVKVFGTNGRPLSTRYELPGRPWALAPAERGLLWVALQDHVEAYRATGEVAVRGAALGPKACLTGLAVAGATLYVADAGNREIVRCDLQGRVLGRFGRLKSGDGNPGFLIPSPYFHVVAGADGLLWVNNPGRHRLEAYTLDGKFELGWGQPSMAVEGFCGCCNPVYFARLPDGRFVTSEKGLNRIKVYNAQGQFAGVVAGPEHLVKDRELARKACANCQIGFGFDVACDSQGRVLALDPATRLVRVFVPKAAAPPS